MKRILLLCFVMWCGAAAAQERFDYLMRRNPWNGGDNAAGIRLDSVSRSYAELYFTKENGGFADRSASDNSWNVGACTQSVRHFEKVTFFGGFSYDYFDGKNMSGSMFTRPGFYPVDIVEFTPGRKVRETYAFTAGLGAKLGTRWTGGLRVDFEAVNYAKRKDLRHENTMLNLEFAPGVLYHSGRFAIGAAYLFGKNSDKIKAELIGKTGVIYEAFFDKGLNFGALEQWDADVIRLKNGAGVDGFPLRETFHGASMQVQYGVLYADAAYRHSTGCSGEKNMYWHDFAGSEVKARAVLTLSGVWSHFVRLRFEWSEQDNREYLIGKENINGVVTNVTYGSTPAFGRKGLEFGGEYEVAGKWLDLRAGASYVQLDRESRLMYPYVKGQKLHYTEIFAKAIWTFGRFDLTTGLSGRQGGFSERETALASMDTGDYPKQLTEFYDWSNEYLTATRLGAELALRCNIKQFYVDLSGSYEHGFNLAYVAGANRGAVTIGFGYNF